MANEILVATATVQTSIDGREVRIVAGKTTVRAGHPILDGRESLFALLVPTYELEVEAEPEPEPESKKTPTAVPQSKAVKSETSGGAGTS